MKLDVIPVASDLGSPEPGSRFGPEALRVSGLQARLSSEARVRWHSTLAAGDTPNGVAALAELSGRLAAQVAASRRHGALPLVLGGDHAIAVGTWSGVAGACRRDGALGLLWIDAHMDSHTPQTSETGNLHGMPLAALLGHGDPALTGIGDAQPKVLPQYTCLVGVRSFEVGEAELLLRLGVRVFTSDEVARRGLPAVMLDALAIVGRAPAGFGITIDVDALDPAEAPGVTVPEAHGLHAGELQDSLAGIAHHPRLRALEVVEYNPLHDVAGRTAQVVVGLIERLLDKEESHVYLHRERKGPRRQQLLAAAGRHDPRRRRSSVG